jgi:hypothetical protein
MSFFKHEKDVVFCERFKAIMHPLSECHHGSDHDRLRQLYIELLEQCIGDPLEQARRLVIHEILHPYMHNHSILYTDSVHVVIYQTNLAISSLSLLIGHLEEGDHKAASESLEDTKRALQLVNDHLNKVSANPEVVI